MILKEKRLQQDHLTGDSLLETKNQFFFSDSLCQTLDPVFYTNLEEQYQVTTEIPSKCNENLNYKE